LVHICDCTPAGIRDALAELPETLDETYERTLRWIKKANWEFAHRMFQFLSVASRPLCVNELADIFGFDFKAGSIPKFHEDRRQENPADAVLSTCSTLLAIVNDQWQESPIIQFSHFSAKEFLTSTRLAEATDIVSRRYHVSMTPAHTLAAQACLGILLHLNKDVTRDSLEDFPLAKYAAGHWIDHARFKDVSRNVEDGMKQLFDPSKPHLTICVWICDPIDDIWKREETPPPLPRTPLHYAAYWGLHPFFEFLVIEYSQDVCSQDSPDSGTPLHLASRSGHVKAACKLIEHGADVSAQNKGGRAPLHLASSWGQVDAARMLIERGADLTAQDDGGNTPLHLALGGGKIDVTRMLIERGADVKAQDKNGKTPLHLASQSGQVDVVRMLIERGADLTAKFGWGLTPLHLASDKGQVEVVRTLIELGADLTAQNNDGETPLHLVSRWGRVEIACMLVEHGADLTAQNDDGKTPLHLASQRGQVDVARMLIERGADLTAQNNDGDTPLHMASARSLRAGISPQKYAKVAHMLLEHGADVNARNKNGLTPFLLSWERGNAHVLVEHGADSGAYDNDEFNFTLG
jgi:ankyrin repeat protein